MTKATIDSGNDLSPVRMQAITRVIAEWRFNN